MLVDINLGLAWNWRLKGVKKAAAENGISEEYGLKNVIPV